jgi:hypothetical protein
MKKIKYLIANLTDAEKERIFSKITINEKTNCWIWTGAILAKRGYGVINFRGHTEYIHRLLYSYFVAPIPMGVGMPVLDHIICNTPSCCNPEHLKLGTQKRNVLRGKSPMAINARKTHCINGHPLPQEPNESWGENRKGRRCIICRKENRKKRYHNKKISHGSLSTR